MPRHAKTTRRTWQHSARAASKFVHPAALATVKMMMVGLARYLVASRLAGQRNGFEPAVRQQRLDIAVDGGDAQRIVMMLGGSKRFFRREWAIRLDEGVANGLFLAGIAWDGLWHLRLMITRFQFHLQYAEFRHTG